jgi:diaminopimelate epimerase
MTIPFIKMHGLGNDFVILDARSNSLRLNPAQIRRISDRRLGIGCDQFIVLDKPANGSARFAMRIFNSDGSASGACGNAARCVARLEKDHGGPSEFFIETEGALLSVKVGGTVAVDMGPARTGWKDIPLSHEMDTLEIDAGGKFGLPPAVGVNVGNPHAVFFVDKIEEIDLEKIGPQIENDPLFPERTNVEFVSVKNRSTLRMRVWERGVGITQACGTGACAVLVAAVRRGLADRKAEVVLDGGTLGITWLENNHVLMEGPTAYSFSGEISDEMMRGV